MTEAPAPAPVEMAAAVEAPAPAAQEETVDNESAAPIEAEVVKEPVAAEEQPPKRSKFAFLFCCAARKPVGAPLPEKAEPVADEESKEGAPEEEPVEAEVAAVV